MILVVQSEWNASITDKLAQAASEKLLEEGHEAKLMKVPGALEIPLAIKWAWSWGQNEQKFITGAVAVGCVIKGETQHFELVANECSRSLSDLSLELRIPIGHGVLATYDLEQAMARSEGSANKGLEAADAVIRMLKLRESMPKALA